MLEKLNSSNCNFTNDKKMIDEILEKLKQKDYILTIYETGYSISSNPENRIPPRRYYKICSLQEIPSVIETMQQIWWRHPNIKENMTIDDWIAIPDKEKVWGITSNIVIEPFSEEFKKSYIESNKKVSA